SRSNKLRPSGIIPLGLSFSKALSTSRRTFADPGQGPVLVGVAVAPFVGVGVAVPPGSRTRKSAVSSTASWPAVSLAWAWTVWVPVSVVLSSQLLMHGVAPL